MIHIKIKTILNLRDIFGAETDFDVPEGSTLADLLSAMAHQWGDKFSTKIFQPGTKIPLAYLRLMVNGRDIAFLNRLDTQLHEDDEVLILPPVSGG